MQTNSFGKKWLAAVTTFLSLALLAACGGGGGDSTTDPNAGLPYFEVYGAAAGDYNMTTSGHTLIGTSDTGNDFNVSGYDRFIIYAPASSSKILFDAIALDSTWVESQAGNEYALYTRSMDPTTGDWATNDVCIEGAPDGNTMENELGHDAYFGFTTNGASNLHIYVYVP